MGASVTQCDISSWCPLHKPGYHCELMGRPQCIPDMVLRLFFNASGCRKLKGCEYKYPSSFQLSDHGILSRESKTISINAFLSIYIISTHFKRLSLSSQHQTNTNRCLMCLRWPRAKVPRRTKNLSRPPFSQNQKILNQGSM